jgi:NTE family protein
VGSAGLTVVLGAGGARGVAHAAVLRGLRRANVPVDALVGCSVGAIVAAMYAACGMEPDEMLEASRRLNAASLFAFALSRWRIPLLSGAASSRSGDIPGHLDRLGGATFERLHHGVRRLGVLTFDLRRRQEVLVAGGPDLPAPIPLSDAVKASAAIPFLFPPLRATLDGNRRFLVDPGWLTAVPVERAFDPLFGAERVIAVDLSLIVCRRQARRDYWPALQAAHGDRLIVLRPDVRRCGTMISWPKDPERLTAAGEEAVAAALPALSTWIGTGLVPRPAVP